VLALGAPQGEEAGLVFEPILTSAVELLTITGERIGRELSLERLRDRRLVALHRGSAFRRHLEDAFGAARVPFRPAVEVGNLSLVRRFVAAGLGVAPVPSIAFERDPGVGRVQRHRLRGVPPLTYGLARRAGVPLTPTADRFIALLQGDSNRFSAAEKKRLLSP
jgi:DNA-binding transcriptional LysR family regulator